MDYDAVNVEDKLEDVYDAMISYTNVIQFNEESKEYYEYLLDSIRQGIEYIQVLEREIRGIKNKGSENGMNTEIVRDKIKEYNMECTFRIFLKEKAIDYNLYWINNDIKIGVFFNNTQRIIGILTFTDEDMYSTDKLLKKIKTFDKNSSSAAFGINEKEKLLDYWNENIAEAITHHEEEMLDEYKEIELTLNELEKYFIKTIETHEGDTDNSWDVDCKWTTYYMNPPCGLSIKINETTISYYGQQVNKLVIYESEHHKTIYCYDKEEDKWMEDIDIITKESLDNIRFLFEKKDLRVCSTINKEQQAYVELYEKLNPYSTVEENRKIVEEFITAFNKFKNTLEESDSDGT